MSETPAEDQNRGEEVKSDGGGSGEGGGGGDEEEDEKDGSKQKKISPGKSWESDGGELKSWTGLDEIKVQESPVASTSSGVFGASASGALGAAGSSRKYISEETGGGGGGGGNNMMMMMDPEMEDYSEDDTEVSSEAVVDDIELILMPEEVEDLPAMDHSPKLVRVTELNLDNDMNEYGEEDENEFFKMGEEEGEEEEDYEEDDPDKSPQYRDTASGHDKQFGDDGGAQEEDDEEEDEDDNTENEHSSSSRRLSGGDGPSSSGGIRKGRLEKVHSGVQTDISALEKDGEDDGETSFSEDGGGTSHASRFEWRRRKTLTLTGVGIATNTSNTTGGSSSSGSKPIGRLGTPRGKKLNWKSELTLLPSKTKIGFVQGTATAGMSLGGSSGFGAFSYANSDYLADPNYPSHHDQYSPRVAKFTSQDNVMSSSSQFLKPSTLYRTRNLSRNLNHFASSENTFMQEQPDSPRFQVSTQALCTSSANFRGSTSVSSNQICMPPSFLSSRRRMSSSSVAKNFRQSLPDLTSSGPDGVGGARRRHLGGRPAGSKMNYPGNQHPHGGFRLHKKSSSDDETSSLIDESERCLRSSIDLLLTDDYPSPGCDYPYMPRSGGGSGGGGFGGGSTQPYTTSASGLGYYSGGGPRRSCSQPLLTDQGLCGEPRDPCMGSPFLPRTLKEMRCSRWAKVILPNGLVAVVCVKEMDELRDCLTVHTETGCVITIPFRKVVFAWRMKR